MSDIKYTTDGRKVRVIGSLNSKELIVQEIYVDEKSGAEISAGENFVAKSLLDAPAKSWKQKDIENTEKVFASHKKEYEKLHKDLRDKTAITKLMIQNTVNVNKYFNIDGLELLDAFIAGEITHLIKVEYSSIDIVEFGSAIKERPDGSWAPEYLKLVSLYGKYDGKLEWRLNQYRDGSGMADEIIPCSGYDHAKDVAQKMMDKIVENRGVGSDAIECAKKYGLRLPPEKVKEYKDNRINNMKLSIEAKKREIANLEKEIAAE